MIIDPKTGREWNFWQTSFDGVTLRAVNGSIVPGSYFTSVGAHPPSRGAGIAYQAMLVRPSEIIAGVIPHAFAQSVNNTDGNGAFEFEDMASAKAEWQAVGMGNAQDMLDGLMSPSKIYAIVPSDQYP